MIFLKKNEKKIFPLILNRKSSWQTGLIQLQTLIQLQVGVSVHETLDKLLTEPVSPV
jgi:hypothetical protein